MIAVDTAKVFAVAATSIPKIGIVEKLANKPVERRPGAGREAGQIKEEPKPESVAKGLKYQDFGSVRIEIERLVPAGFGQVTVFVDYVNKTDRELIFGLIGAGMRQKTFLLNNKGDRYFFAGGSGLSGDWCAGQWCPGTTLLRVPPKGRSTASLTFTVTGMPGEISKGATFSFTSEQAFVEDDKPTKVFNIAIRDIEPR